MFRPDDTEEILAFFEWQDEQCPGGGHSKRDGYNPALEDAWLVEAVRCHACATSERRMQDFDDRAGLYTHAYLDQREVTE